MRITVDWQGKAAKKTEARSEGAARGLLLRRQGSGALQTPALRVKRRPRDGLEGNSFPKAMGQKLINLRKS